jgi:hypothetical protein
MVDVTPGDSGANKGFWRYQLRDRKTKRFIPMGSGVIFETTIPGVDGIVRARGFFRGMVDLETAKIEVMDNSEIPRGTYFVKSEFIEEDKAKARLSKDFLEKKLGTPKVSTPAAEPSSQPVDLSELEIEALGWYTDTGYDIASKFLRQGIPIQDEEDKKYLDAILGLIDRSKTDRNITAYRGRAVISEERLAAIEALKPGDKITDRGIMSVSELKSRAEFYAQMKLGGLAKAHIMFELDIPAGTPAYVVPDKYSTYRSQEQETLLSPNVILEVSEVSVDDYGRKYIKVKVVSEQAPAVESPRESLPPIYQKELETVKMIQSLGQSPETLTKEEIESVEKYRGFKKSGQGSFFYEKLNAYLRYKDQLGFESEDYSDEVKNLDSILEKFEGLPEDTIVYRGVGGRSKRYQDLKVGEEISDAGYTSTSLNEGVAWGFATGDDGADDYRGFLIEIRLPKGTKVIDPIAATESDPEKLFRERAQERGANTTTEREFILPRGSKFRVVERIDEPEDSFETDTPTRFVLELVEPVSVEENTAQPAASSEMYEEFFDAGMIDLGKLRKSKPGIDQYDEEMFSYDQLKALEWYGQAGHKVINKILRSGDPISEENQAQIDAIDEAIKENGDVYSAGRVFRGDYPTPSSDYYKFLQGLTEGQVIASPGYFSTSNDASIAFSEFGPGTRENDEDASQGNGTSSFFWTIDIPENGKAMGMPEGVGFGQGVESEVLLPRNTKLKIIGIKKVEQIDEEDGESTGEFNYFIHAEQIPTEARPEAVEPELTSSEPDSPSIVEPGFENWVSILPNVLALTRDSEDENNNFDPELGNKRLSTVMEMAGYNAKPKLATQEEFDSIEGEPIYRGITAEGAVNQYIHSPKHFAGEGKFGNGTYSTNDRKTALNYGGGSENNVLEMKLSPDANIKKFDSRKDYLDWIEDTMAKVREDYANSGPSNDEYYDFISQMDNVVDWTNVAVMLGIDAIEFPHSVVLEERYTIVLNRGKVIVNDKP